MADAMQVLVTGANGFIGRAVCAQLYGSPYAIVTGVVKYRVRRNTESTHLISACLSEDTDWSAIVRRQHVIVHVAARVHVMHDDAEDPLAEFRAVNVDGTLKLAKQAAEAGVRRFIFISSIKVNGEETGLGNPYTAGDTPSPVDPYGISKMEAEQGLMALAAKTGMEVTIIRPVLVYGPGVKANFRSMMHWLNKGAPLPLGSINNKRSLVALDNLVDLIVTCIGHPAAANQVFLVSDGEDLSTTELLRRTANALGKPARLLPVPAFLLKAGLAVIGRKNIAQRLCGSLQVDITKTRSLLGWNPPVKVDDALKRTAESFKYSLKN